LRLRAERDRRVPPEGNLCPTTAARGPEPAPPGHR
jgi:hypothetical protein